MSTLTPFPDMAPVPRVLVDVPVGEFPAGSVTVSITRRSEGRTMQVRGGQRLPATSPAIVIDTEAGFGVVSEYTVLGYDSAGAVIGSWPIGSTTLVFDQPVVQQPLDPRLAVVAVKLGGTDTELVRETPGTPAWPQGSALPGVISMGPRRGLDGVELELMVDANVADTLQATLGTYERAQLPIWLVRTPPGRRLPAVFFCHVPRLRERDALVQLGIPRVLYSAVVTEVKPPAAGITAAVLTHSDMKVFFTTHTQVKAAYATHADVKRDMSLIGAASA
jgi:hypothetical protein